MKKDQEQTFLGFVQEALNLARNYLEEKLNQSNFDLSKEEQSAAIDQHFPEMPSSETLVWDNLDEALAHYLTHVYKSQLKSTPKHFKPIYYDFLKNHNRKEAGKLSVSKKLLMLFLGNYDVEITEKGFLIRYPRDKDKLVVKDS